MKTAFQVSGSVRQLNFIPEQGKYIGQGQRLKHHLLGAQSTLHLHLAAWSHHTGRSTASNYHVGSGRRVCVVNCVKGHT